MNVLAGFSLYLAGSFALIYLSLVNIVPTNYLGGLVIGLFIAGLFFAFGNTIYQTKKMNVAEQQKTVNEKKEEPPKVA